MRDGHFGLCRFDVARKVRLSLCFKTFGNLRKSLFYAQKPRFAPCCWRPFLLQEVQGLLPVNLERLERLEPLEPLEPLERLACIILS